VAIKGEGEGGGEMEGLKSWGEMGLGESTDR